MDFNAKIKEKYSYLSNEEVDNVVNRAIEIFFNTKYPFVTFDERPKTVPSNYERWILKAVDELIERENIAGAKTYAENGVNMTFDHSEISLGLLNEIVPMAGAIND